MEITLEKIELVKDRTGATYKDSKDALEKCEGNVVDAIIMLEGNLESKADKDKKECLVSKIEEIIKRGNISKIIVKKDGEVILNIPLTVGIIGTVIAPWIVIAGAVASVGFKCQIEFIKDDGTLIDLTEQADGFYEKAVETGNNIYGTVKEKTPEYYENIVEKGNNAIDSVKEKANSVKQKFVKADEETCPECEDEAKVKEADVEEKSDSCSASIEADSVKNEASDKKASESEVKENAEDSKNDCDKKESDTEKAKAEK